MSNYLPHTESERVQMLKELGAESIEEFFSDIPENIRLKGDLDLPEPLTEPQLKNYFKKLADKNKNLEDCSCFLGAGVYDHYIPSVVQHLTLRNEFYTAYTPYQAEISQGLLQAIFEYQTMISELTGMDASNASMYDGATSTAEAAIMSLAVTRGNEVIVSKTVNPAYRQVLRTYIESQGFNVVELEISEGITELTSLKEKISNNTAAVIIQTPNFFGNLEDLEQIQELTSEFKTLLVTVQDPISLAILEPPKSFGADIVVGDGQSLGNPTSFGGPLLGFFSTTKRYIRKLPGRLVGETNDVEGNRGYVLTLQTREQHIRRERATSNICSNQALNALTGCIYLSVMGPTGLEHVAKLSLQKAAYAARTLSGLQNCELAFESPFFKEFVIKLPKPAAEVNRQLLEHDIIGGLDMGRFYPDMKNNLLVCVTEQKSKEEIDDLAEKLEAIL